MITARAIRARQLVSGFERWGLLGLAVCLLAALWALIVVWATLQKDQVIAAGQRELTQLTQAAALQTAGMFSAVETALHTLDFWLTANPDIDPRTDAHFVALVDELRRAADGLIDLRLIAANGIATRIPAFERSPLADVSAQAFFTAQMERPEPYLYIGHPALGRAANRWEVPVSLRLQRPVSGIVVVYATISLDHLFLLHERMRLKPNGSIALMLLDGTIFSRTPELSVLIGKNVADQPRFASEYGTKQQGVFISDTSVSDIPRLISYERLERFPVVVLVTQSLDTVLSAWRLWRDRALLGGAGLTLLTLVFTAFLHRALRARRIAEREMRWLARTDSLTNLPNRRALFQFAEHEFKRARRYYRPFALLMLDIDHFKRINDTYGHAAGDQVLHSCAAGWKQVLRGQDLIGRTGGEEFCAILPETTLETAFQIAQRLRVFTSELPFPEISNDIVVTVSIGVASLEPSDDQLAEMLERADRALYQAKKSGRDRVECIERRQDFQVLAEI